ncbi:FtsK/SpoIIIE domain-containing protein [Nesterenkonia flava]
MTVVLKPRISEAKPGPPTRRQTSGLRLCIDSGPDAGRLLSLSRGRYVLGRGQADVRIADPALSRRHARIDVERERVLLHDTQGSRTFSLGAPQSMGNTRVDLVRSTLRRAAEISWPVPPAQVEERPPETRHRSMLMMALLPLAVGIVLVAVTGMWFFLLFSAAGALMATAFAIHGRLQRRRYRQALRSAAQQWAAVVDAALPSPGALARWIQQRTGTPLVPRGDHSREPRHPTVRIGTALVPAELAHPTEASPPPQDEQRVTVPLACELRAGEHTVITGPLSSLQGLVRWIVLQMVANQHPVRIITPDAATATAVRDHPSVEFVSPERLEAWAAEVVSGRELGASAAVSSTPLGILLSAEPLPCHVAERLTASGWHVVSPERSHHDIDVPGWNVHLSSEHPSSGSAAPRSVVSSSMEHASHLRPDGISQKTLAALARRSLQGISGTPGTMPDQCIETVRAEFSESAHLQLISGLGRDERGPVVLDLVEDGPHILVAGTTGAGKSELLKTLLLSLASRYGPREVNLLLFDFKGGATFRNIATLEHSLGLVTDLSQAQVERTLEGLRSELMRRERLFLEADAGDYSEYRLRCPDFPLARIVVALDEFRIFSHELPETMDELMRLATLGRSLGIHLVLATQRPQGVVTADMKANIGSIIALRLRSEDESRELLGTPSAALLSRRQPGRAFLRRPGEAAMEFQAAQLAAVGARSVRLIPAVLPWTHLQSPGPSESEVVDLLRQELTARQLFRNQTPLLPPLPQHLTPGDRLTSETLSGILLGRVDDPSQQEQRDVVLEPRSTPRSIALIGEPTAGGEEALLGWAQQLAESPDRVDLYLLDGSRSLASLSAHPRVGAWLTPDDDREAEYLLARLREDILRSSLQGADVTVPRVLVVSGNSHWHTLAQSLRTFEQDLSTLVAEGPAAGLSVLLAGGRELALGKLAARIPQRIYLPFGADEDTRYLWPPLRSTEMVPSRGVLLSPRTPSPGLCVQLVNRHSTAQGTARPQGQGPPPELTVRTLPERLGLTGLLKPEPVGPETLTIGVQQLTGAPAQLRLGRVCLILGTSGTGKTTALMLLATQLQRAGVATAGIFGRGTQSQLASLAPLDQEHMSSDVVVLVDDADRCGTDQQQMIQQAIATGASVVATAQPNAALFSHLTWAHPARTAGEHLILSPTQRSHADAFAAVIPVLQRPVPGRAVHLRPEGPRIVQLADPTI